MKAYRIASALAVLTLGASQLQAQATTPEQEVLAVVNRFFDGMRAQDTTVIRGTLFGDVRLLTTGTNREGKLVARAEAMDGFIQSIPKIPGKPDERISAPEVRVEDNLATVWTRYEFYLGDKYSHCGIDAFQLVKTESGWKIATIADTRRQSCK
jgi:hypothetical protein